METSTIQIKKTISAVKPEIISINPATEEELGRVPALSRDGIDEHVEKARRAFLGWSNLTVKERGKYLKRLLNVIVDDVDEIATLIAMEQGKTCTEAKFAEIIPVLAHIRHMQRTAGKTLRTVSVKHEQILFTHKKSQYRYVPYGVVAIISTWNYPFTVPMPEIVTALIAGNTVVFKPAPGTILLGKKMDELFKQAGFPEGVVNTICIQDDDASYFVGHVGVNKIIFTGSTKTGQNVMCTAASHILPVLLELGGKDPAIVTADADIERAARGIVWGAMFNAGQVCASIERVYVERPAAEQFISACVGETKKINVGNPLDENVDIGPLENERQLAMVISHVKDAQQKGAKIMCGGNKIGDKGFFFAPTILTDVDHSMKIMTEETFGPVLPIMVVDSLDEAIRLANDSQFGLSATGWTSDKKKAERMQQELEAGTVMINDVVASWGEPNAPWGGFKKSGIGKIHSHFGLRDMVQIKYTSYEKGKKSFNFWWFPYDRAATEIASQAVKLMFAKRLRKKIVPLFRLLKNKRFVVSVYWGRILMNLKKLF